MTLGLQILLRTGLLMTLTCALVAQYWSADVGCPRGHLHLEAPGWILQLGVARPLQWNIAARNPDIEQCFLNPFFEHRQWRVLNVPSGVAHELRWSPLGSSRMMGVRHVTLVFLMAAANVIWFTLRARRRRHQAKKEPNTTNSAKR